MAEFADFEVSEESENEILAWIKEQKGADIEIVTSNLGWFEWFKMPENTTHIAYVYESGGVYLPEDGVSYADFFEALSNGKAYRLVRAEQEEHEEPEAPC